MTSSNSPPSPGSSARRELTRRYKQAPPPMGVYAIRNRLNQRILVGASLNVEGALNRHRFELARGQHRSAALMQDWLRDGADNFSFEVIDVVKPRDDPAFDYVAELDAMLALWREELQAFGDKSYDGAAKPVAPRGVA